MNTEWEKLAKEMTKGLSQESFDKLKRVGIYVYPIDELVKEYGKIKEFEVRFLNNHFAEMCELREEFPTFEEARDYGIKTFEEKIVWKSYDKENVGVGSLDIIVVYKDKEQYNNLALTLTLGSMGNCPA